MKSQLEAKKNKLLSLYLLDFILCHVVIGKSQATYCCQAPGPAPGPSVVAYWRGVWDYSHVWLQEGLCGGDAELANILALVTGLLATLIIDLFHSDLARLAR